MINTAPLEVNVKIDQDYLAREVDFQLGRFASSLIEAARQLTRGTDELFVQDLTTERQRLRAAWNEGHGAEPGTKNPWEDGDEDD